MHTIVAIRSQINLVQLPQQSQANIIIEASNLIQKLFSSHSYHHWVSTKNCIDIKSFTICRSILQRPRLLKLPTWECSPYNCCLPLRQVLNKGPFIHCCCLMTQAAQCLTNTCLQTVPHTMQITLAHWLQPLQTQVPRLLIIKSTCNAILVNHSCELFPPLRFQSQKLTYAQDQSIREVNITCIKVSCCWVWWNYT